MSENQTNISEYINEAFGSNATYVEGLLERYKTDPKLVDESWQAYFSDLLNGVSSAQTSSNGAANAAAAVQPPAETPAASEAALFTLRRNAVSSCKKGASGPWAQTVSRSGTARNTPKGTPGDACRTASSVD